MYALRLNPESAPPLSPMPLPGPDEPIRAFPIAWVTSGRHLLLVGADAMGADRLRTALQYDWARIRLVGTSVHPEVARLAGDPRVEIEDREVAEKDIHWAHFIIESTTDAAVGERVGGWARAAGIPVSTMDKPEHCDFYYTSLIRRGPMVISISSGGASPAIISRLRRYLEGLLGCGWCKAAVRLADLRRRLPNCPERSQLLKDLAADPDLVDRMARDDDAELNAWIAEGERRFREGRPR